ncbi:MAG: molybdate ABC transporter permease subunit [Bacillota bacterium]|uniref:Molybdenum transport system permease n=1 Tax=Virgibacillus salarius TaxID=447199 RepID=A0A941IBE9_9BACI|nr:MULTISPECIES: molybdate ABC transporter permease subunit [Bacillaceae]MBR7795180.1 molybdate ABC transporter permease subunit [Virgibacillus salarius]NAZ07896.1 molybdate ABC transporter permease subunit [Agaribacter marinus]WBX81606.1 molybdate ABC transporter permease subunit [Virgibacillus salarius]
MDLLQNEVVMQKFLSPIWLSIKVTAISGVVVILIGTIVGRFLARKTFKGKALLETIIMLPMVLPPTVVGFLLIILFGKNSIVGQATEWLFKQPLIFTWWAAVIASAVVAFPLVYQSAKTGFQGIDLSIEEAARVDGANEWKIFFLISIPLAFRSLVSGSILSFARALGEFGATLMFAGNIPGVTQTIPMAIYIALDSGNIELAWLWVISIVIISFFMLLMVRIKQE